MNPADLIDNLEALGYQASLDGANLRFRYTRPDDPPQEAVPLLNEVRQRKAEVFDHLRLLGTPMAHLRKPLLIEAEQLGGERIFLAANESQAQIVERSGGVPYLPSEICSMARLAAVAGERWRDSLRNIHEVKKVFPGSRIIPN